MATYRWNRSALLVTLSLIACSSSNSAQPDSGSNPGVPEGGGSNMDGGDAGTTASNDAGSDSACVSPIAPDAGSTANCAVVVKDADCDKNQRPFVFVHGTYAAGDTFSHVAALLGSNGFCQDRIVGVEYDSVNFAFGSITVSNDTVIPQIDAVINQVLQTARDANGNPFTQVDLAGHSQGTMHCGNYLNSDPSHAAKVAHYFNFSGVPNVGNVQTLSLSSMHDLGGRANHATGASVCAAPWTPCGGGVPAGGADGGLPAGCNVVTVTFQDHDHFAVADSTDSFVQVYKYLTGKDPKYTSIQCGDDPVTVEGISETFADNTPVTGNIEIRELGSTPRDKSATPMTLTPDPMTGSFGPIQLKRNVAYEFKGFDSMGNVVGYLYETPFKRSNRLVRMLTPSNNAAVKTASTDHVVRGLNHVAVVARWAGGGFRQDLGASLKVDDEKGALSEALTGDNAGAATLATGNPLMGGVAALFMYDANQNMMTDLGLVYSTSFLAFTDVYMQAATPNFINFSFTAGSEDPATVQVPLKIPNWPSSDALVGVMFQ